MVEAQKYRIEQEMTNLVNELDKSYLRKMQGDMHRCAAKCCDDQQTSLERVHGCIENCTAPLNTANNYVQSSFSSFLHSKSKRTIEITGTKNRHVISWGSNTFVGTGGKRSEINHLQNRLQRCVMDCNDSARDRLGSDPSQETIDKCTIDFEKCAVKCVDKHISIIPSMMKTMKKVLASGKPPPTTEL